MSFFLNKSLNGVKFIRIFNESVQLFDKMNFCYEYLRYGGAWYLEGDFSII